MIYITSDSGRTDCDSRSEDARLMRSSSRPASLDNVTFVLTKQVRTCITHTIRLFTYRAHVQRAAGNWESEHELWAMIGKSEADFMATKPADASADAWITALVIAFLEVIATISAVVTACS